MLRVVRSAAEVRLNSKALLLGTVTTIVPFINLYPISFRFQKADVEEEE